jgi:hypothetical protein
MSLWSPDDHLLARIGDRVLLKDGSGLEFTFCGSVFLRSGDLYAIIDRPVAKWDGRASHTLIHPSMLDLKEPEI